MFQSNECKYLGLRRRKVLKMAKRLHIPIGTSALRLAALSGRLMTLTVTGQLFT